MSSSRAGELSQPTRIALLLVYIVTLLVVSKFALGTWYPATSEKGVWFYSALAAILLGNLIVTPFFTKPADALSYSVAATVGLLAVDIWSSANATLFDRFLWTTALAYASFVLGAAIISMATKNRYQRLSQSLFYVCDTLGSPRAIFSVVFLFALVAFHRTDPREFLSIGCAWAVLVGLRPLEEIVHLWQRVWGAWAKGKKIVRLGKIVGHVAPSLVLIQEEHGQSAAWGDLLLSRDDTGVSGHALALDHVGFADGRWLRAVHLAGLNTGVGAATSDGSVYRVTSSEPIEHPTYKDRDRIVGLVSPDTTPSQLRVELVRGDLPIQQGALLQTTVDTRPVLYQVINGVTREEILAHKNTRGFVRASASVIGAWNTEKEAFEVVPWLPQPNELVTITEKTEATADREAIGHFPGTSYPAKLNTNAMVTHNTAILGILGVGKSFLAIELVERMISAGIKVICLDLTDQYAGELERYLDTAREETETDALRQIGPPGKTKWKQNREEGGSVREFTAKFREQLTDFLNPDDQRLLKILNPVRFEVWRQDGWIKDREAPMASLTPAEITRIITETVLALLQEQGMTAQARCCLVFEEAHSLIPEWNAVASSGDQAATNGTAKAILQGRKFGLGCLVITQRTANVTKSILNQCNTVFALRVFDATGVEFLRNYIGDDYARVLSTLEDRHAVVFGRGSSCRDPALIRLNDREDFLRVFRENQAAEGQPGTEEAGR